MLKCPSFDVWPHEMNRLKVPILYCTMFTWYFRVLSHGITNKFNRIPRNFRISAFRNRKLHVHSKFEKLHSEIENCIPNMKDFIPKSKTAFQIWKTAFQNRKLHFKFERLHSEIEELNYDTDLTPYFLSFAYKLINIRL